MVDETFPPSSRHCYNIFLQSLTVTSTILYYLGLFPPGFRQSIKQLIPIKLVEFKIQIKGGGEQEGSGRSCWGRSESESKEIDIMIKETISGLARNLTRGKLPVIHKDDPS